MENQVKSFEHACQVLGRSTDVPVVNMLPEKHQKAIIAHYKLITICEAANFLHAGKSWEPDWNNHAQWKYFSCFEVEASAEKPSGSRLWYQVYDSTLSYVYVGSRLSFQTSELAEYIGETFIDLYKDLLLL